MGGGANPGHTWLMMLYPAYKTMNRVGCFAQYQQIIIIVINILIPARS